MNEKPPEEGSPTSRRPSQDPTSIVDQDDDLKDLSAIKGMVMGKATSWAREPSVTHYRHRDNPGGEVA